jgi:nitrite transporter NirC
VTGDAAKSIVMAWVLLAFVAAGFEHSVANMTALTLGLFSPGETISLVGVIHNLVMVTIGNVVGGAVFVVGAYGVAAKTDSEPLKG